MQTINARTGALVALFPDGVPSLWCPVITHYTANGGIDRARVAAHLRHLAPHVKGLLIPGSTGDGWELTDAEIRAVLEIVLPEVARLKLHLLIGVLKTDAGEALKMIRKTVSWLQKRTGHKDATTAMIAARVCGFTVCPPKGKHLSQSHIATALTPILDLGLPVSLYQLPQVTENEMSPATVAGLAAKYPNFVLFKDTSGADRVALSGKDLGGVFMVRGAEGDYTHWLKEGGGRYDGFLLSTANCFARELHEVTNLLAAGKRKEAKVLSERLTAVVKEAFEIVAGLPHGNAFANANKAMDHFLAHGPGAADLTPPRLHAGSVLPLDTLQRTEAALRRHGFMPAKGYLGK